MQVTCTIEGRDRYNRALSTCYTADGTDLNAWLVRQRLRAGLSALFNKYIPDEDQARAGRAGIWAGEFVPPWIGGGENDCTRPNEQDLPEWNENTWAGKRRILSALHLCPSRAGGLTPAKTSAPPPVLSVVSNNQFGGLSPRRGEPGGGRGERAMFFCPEGPGSREPFRLKNDVGGGESLMRQQPGTEHPGRGPNAANGAVSADPGRRTATQMVDGRSASGQGAAEARAGKP